MRNDKALVFDFNGTLFWDTDFNKSAWSAMKLKYRGKVMSDEQWRALVGIPSSDTVRGLLGDDLPLTRVNELVEEKESAYRELCWKEGCPHLAPGAENLIRKAHAMGRKIAIATGAPRPNVEAYKKWFPILSLFGDNILIDDGSRPGKPHPDIYLEMMAKLHTDGEHTIVFEDSKAGLLSAESASVREIYLVGSNGSCPLEKAPKGVIPLRDFDAFVL